MHFEYGDNYWQRNVPVALYLPLIFMKMWVWRVGALCPQLLSFVGKSSCLKPVSVCEWQEGQVSHWRACQYRRAGGLSNYHSATLRHIEITSSKSLRKLLAYWHLQRLGIWDATIWIVYFLDKRFRPWQDPVALNGRGEMSSVQAREVLRQHIAASRAQVNTMGSCWNCPVVFTSQRHCSAVLVFMASLFSILLCLFACLVGWNYVSLCLPLSWNRAGLRLTVILLPLLPKSWDYRHRHVLLGTGWFDFQSRNFLDVLCFYTNPPFSPHSCLGAGRSLARPTV